MIRTLASSSFKNSKQLQDSDNVNQILPKIKMEDTSALCVLLKPLFEARIHWRKYCENTGEDERNRTVTITDLGCGEGQMILTLLKVLSENLKNFLALRIKIYAYDVQEDMIVKYKDNFDTAKRLDSYLSYVSIERAEVKKFQDVVFPQSDVFLASHSFYYCREIWDTSDYNNNKSIDFNEHLLTRLLASLKKKGAICVILQSNRCTGVKGKQKLFLANHENFEDQMYPLKIQFDSNGEKILKNAERDTFTNAEIFEQCFQEYRKIWIANHASDLEITSKQSMAIIELGEINFELHEATQKYEQSDAVTALLNFYTRQLYAHFNPEAQKKLLDFIKTDCLRDDGAMVMCHVNRLFLICPTEKIVFEETLINQTREELSSYVK
jgi:chemotaxis methyl-accepting protein methylase